MSDVSSDSSLDDFVDKIVDQQQEDELGEVEVTPEIAQILQQVKDKEEQEKKKHPIQPKLLKRRIPSKEKTWKTEAADVYDDPEEETTDKETGEVINYLEPTFSTVHRKIRKSIYYVPRKSKAIVVTKDVAGEEEGEKEEQEVEPEEEEEEEEEEKLVEEEGDDLADIRLWDPFIQVGNYEDVALEELQGPMLEPPPTLKPLKPYKPKKVKITILKMRNRPVVGSDGEQRIEEELEELEEEEEERDFFGDCMEALATYESAPSFSYGKMFRHVDMRKIMEDLRRLKLIEDDFTWDSLLKKPSRKFSVDDKKAPDKEAREAFLRFILDVFKPPPDEADYEDDVYDTLSWLEETTLDTKKAEEQHEEIVAREEVRDPEKMKANLKYRIIIEPPDEEEVEFVPAEEEEEEHIIPKYEDVVSREFLSENCTFPQDALIFDYSYGYDCQKLFNLVVPDVDHLIFASGNIIHIYNIHSKTFTFRRTISGRGIGHIARNYTNNEIAVGEKGDRPWIVVYQWPEFEIVDVLYNGTEKEYVHLQYRDDGEFLVSQGGEPDNLITVWNIKKSKILLQVKSHTQEVSVVGFSRYVLDNLTTGGLGHIKFWKMAKTFTGLKLQGEIGKFGKTDICDITGFFAMPDEKVVSGCDWGNILVWDEGLIKFEVSRKKIVLEKVNGVVTKREEIQLDYMTQRGMSTTSTASKDGRKSEESSRRSRTKRKSEFTEHKRKSEIIILSDIEQDKVETEEIMAKSKQSIEVEEDCREGEEVEEEEVQKEEDSRERSSVVTDEESGRFLDVSKVSDTCPDCDDAEKELKECVDEEEVIDDPYEDKTKKPLESETETEKKTESEPESEGLTEGEVATELVQSTVEVYREKCHDAPITQFSYNTNDGYLQTIGLDGFVKTWYFKFINEQDPPEDEPFVYIEPSHSLEIADSFGRASLLSYAKVDINDSNYNWFLQDCSGGIWDVDVATEPMAPQPERILKCHSGPIVDMCTSPFDNYVATCGDDGWLHIYNMKTAKLVILRKFIHPINCIIWLPPSIDINGNMFMIGQEDGKIRILVGSIKEIETVLEYSRFDDESESAPSSHFLNILFSIKCHNKAVTSMAINETGNLLVSGGGDSTAFAYEIERNPLNELQLLPIGFIKTPSPVTYVGHKPATVNTFIICCNDGHFLEVDFLDKASSVVPKSYDITSSVKIRKQRFKSIKSEIRRQIEMDEIEKKKEEKIVRKKQELEKIRRENPGLDINEELYLVDSSEDIEFPPLYYPETPSPIKFARYHSDKLIWISVSGYDSGYIYVYKMDDPNPVKFVNVPNIGDYEVSSYTLFHQGDIMALGLGNGKIRLVKLYEDKEDDLTDYWELAMHDNDTGKITKVCLSADQKQLFTCGTDGNIFSFTVSLSDYHLRARSFQYLAGLPSKCLDDLTDQELSLEEERLRVDRELRQKKSERHKKNLRKTLDRYKHKFMKIVKRNNLLPPQFRLDHFTEFQFDPRISKRLNDIINGMKNEVKRKYAYRVEKSQLLYKKLHDYYIDPVAAFRTTISAIRKEILVTTIVHRKCGKPYYEAEDYLIRTTRKETMEDKGRRAKNLTDVKRTESELTKPKVLPPWLKGINSFYTKLDTKALRALDKYLERKKREESRGKEWSKFLGSKPDINKMDPQDALNIEQAMRTIGDYKLKTSKEFKVPKTKRVSTRQKYFQLLNTRKQVYDLKQMFNKKVFTQREEKAQLVKRFQELHVRLCNIHREIPESLRKFPPNIPTINVEKDYPEREFMIDPGPSPVSEKYEFNEFEDEELYVLYPQFSKFEIPLSIIEEPTTQREVGLRERRQRRKLQEQEDMLKEMEDKIIKYDKRVEKLYWERMDILIQIKILEIFVLTLYQELIVTKGYERLEDELAQKVANMTILKSLKILKMNVNKKKIGSANAEITKLQEKEKDVHRTFQDMVAENKFAEFLSRIFRKKYKPPKVRRDDESESSSSSSDEDEDEGEDVASVDSGDLDLLKLDDNICPDGCEQEVYDKTFELRKRRYDIELSLQDLKKQADILRKDNDFHHKKVIQIDVLLKIHQEQVESFQRRKQAKLNEIETVVILKASQLQHLKVSNEYEPIDKTVIFPKEVLLQLNNRVAELEEETKQEILKHQRYKIHLKRILIDLKQMEETIVKIKKEIEVEMITKFGCVINVDIMEDSILKQMITHQRFQVRDLQAIMDREIAQYKLELLEKSEELATIQRVNTEKLHLLAAIEEEKGKVAKFAEKQLQKRSRLPKRIALEKEMTEDIEKLNEVFEKLCIQRQKLMDEIKALSLKGRPLPPISKQFKKAIKDRPLVKEPLLPTETSSTEIVQESVEFDPLINVTYDTFFKNDKLVPSPTDSYYDIYWDKVKQEDENQQLQEKLEKEIASIEEEGGEAVPFRDSYSYIFSLEDLKPKVDEALARATADSLVKLVLKEGVERAAKSLRKSKSVRMADDSTLGETEVKVSAKEFIDAVLCEAIGRAVKEVSSSMIKSVLEEAVAKSVSIIKGETDVSEIKHAVDEQLPELLEYELTYITEEEESQQNIEREQEESFPQELFQQEIIDIELGEIIVEEMQQPTTSTENVTEITEEEMQPPKVSSEKLTEITEEEMQPPKVSSEKLTEITVEEMQPPGVNPEELPEITPELPEITEEEQMQPENVNESQMTEENKEL